MRIITLFALVICCSAMGEAPAQSDIRVTVNQLDNGAVRVTYDLAKPRRELIFAEVAAGHRERRWTIGSSDFKLVRLSDGDRIHRVDLKKFDQVVLTAAPDLIRIPKNYQPLVRYGDGGVMIYTGHFWPVTERGGRVNTTFTFVPAIKGRVVTFGDRAARLDDWRSPMAHPAFVYMGPLTPVETKEVMAIIDPGAPQWIIDEFYEMTPRVFRHLAEIFNFFHDTKPNLFLAAPLGPDEGRLSYSGDALPMQFQITLEGRAWRRQTEQTEALFRRSTIHEAIHLWQAAARPSVEEVAAWIHEGAADAIAAEVMLALGYWNTDEYADHFEKAKTECASKLEEGALSGAEARGDFRALYACGHVIAVAISNAENARASDFWRDFISVARARDGYTEELFFRIVEERVENHDFNEALRSFVRTPPADPEREIDRLLAAARAPLARGAAR